MLLEYRVLLYLLCYSYKFHVDSVKRSMERAAVFLLPHGDDGEVLEVRPAFDDWDLLYLLTSDGVVMTSENEVDPLH